jgi:hypothetical protein
MLALIAPTPDKSANGFGESCRRATVKRRSRTALGRQSHYAKIPLICGDVEPTPGPGSMWSLICLDTRRSPRPRFTCIRTRLDREPRWIAAARLVWWRRAPAPPRQQPVSLTVGDRTASARITERTPWGSYSVAGVGAPPFTVEPIELMTLS